MLDIKFIRENKDLVRKSIEERGMSVDIDELLGLDEKRRTMIVKIEDARATRNKKSGGKPSPEEIEKMRALGDEINTLEKEYKELESYYSDLLKRIPNMIHPDTPRGGEENFNVVGIYGEIPKFSFEPKDHETLMQNLDLIDFERGAKVAASKFYFSKKDLVRLNLALINYGIDVATKNGFELIETPDLAKNDILSGIGFNPRGEAEDQIYTVEKTDLGLIATAEITMGGYHSDEILDLSNGPKKYVAVSHCFRKEAGAYGRESRGLYRVHQFTKLEMFVYCKPDESEEMHKHILDVEQKIVEGLGLPFRIIDIASGDLGSPAYRKYDIEAWMVMKKGYGEITSTSNCTDYQARRLNIRYRTHSGDTELVHTLNGTAVVLSRFPIAIFENYQTEQGTIKIPDVLQRYMGGLKEIK